MRYKKFVLTIIATMLFIYSYAQVIASLHKSGVVQHFSGADALANAYTASANGDTIYLSGGSFVPPSSFDKGLTIYGAGHYPDSTLATGKTFINGTINLNANADNFQIEGIEVTEGIVFVNNVSVNQVTVKYCKVNGIIHVMGNLTNPSNNLAFIESVLVGDITLSNATNLAMFNCIVQSHIVNSIGNIFSNNIFLYLGAFNNMVLSSICINNTFNNNIFLQTSWNAITQGSGNSFRNNLFILAAPEFATAYTSENNYFGIEQASIFIDQTANAFNYLHNYRLKSPGTYLGTDGMTIGIYGGVFSYKEGAVPSNPHIQLKNISTTTDSQGKLNVNIRVAAQDR